MHNLSIAQCHLGLYEDSVQTFGKKAKPYANEKTAFPETTEAYAFLAVHYDGNTLHQTFSRRLIDIFGTAAPNHQPRQILELGCGTGILGTLLPACLDRLVGIDLSPDMLAKAQITGRYDQLLQGDMVSVMSEIDDSFDTILSTGVLYHIADLSPVFTQAFRLLGAGGFFAFSVDPLADGQDIAITNPGEYCHSRGYLRRLAAHVGFTEISIKIDVHRKTPGFWCIFQK